MVRRLITRGGWVVDAILFALVALMCFFTPLRLRAAATFSQLDQDSNFVQNRFNITADEGRVGQPLRTSTSTELFVLYTGTVQGCVMGSMPIRQYATFSDWENLTNASSASAVRFWEVSPTGTAVSRDEFITGTTATISGRFIVQYSTSSFTSWDSSKFYSFYANGDCGDVSRKITLRGSGVSDTSQPINFRTKMFFIASDTFEDLLTGNDKIQFVNPINGMQTLNFNAWVVQVAAGTTSTNRDVQIYYSRFSSSTFEYQNGSTVSGANSGSYQVTIPKTQPLMFAPLPSPTRWYAQAVIRDNSVAIASTTIFFDVYQTLPSSTQPDANPCDNPVDYCGGGNESSTGILAGFKRGICETLVCLFVPPAQTINQFSQLKDSLSNKPPFGYIGVIASATAAFASGTTTSTLQGSTLPIFSILAVIITTGFAILALLYLYKRFVHFEP